MPARSTIKVLPERYANMKCVASKNGKSVKDYAEYAFVKLPLLEDLLLRLLQDNSAETQSKLRNEGLKLLKM